MSISDLVEIGLTSQDLLKKKQFSSKLENYQTRKNNLEKFISTIADLNRVNIVEIKNWTDMDKYAQDPEYEGLIVSQETYENAQKLNENRILKGLKPLVLIVIPIIKDEDNNKISSTALRKKIEKQKEHI